LEESHFDCFREAMNAKELGRVDEILTDDVFGIPLRNRA